MRTAKKVAKNTTITIFSNIVVKIVALIISVYLARYLGSSDFGKYTFIVTYFMFFNVIGGFGLDSVLIRDIARDKSLTNKIFNNALILRVLTSLIAVVLSVSIGLIIFDNSNSVRYYIALTSIIIVFQGISLLIESLFQAYLEAVYISIAVTVSKLAHMILVIFLISTEASLTYVLVVLIISEVVRTVIGTLYLTKFVKMNFKLEINLFKSLFIQSIPFVFSYALYMLYYRIDIFMLAFMQGDDAVGLYAAAYKLTDPLLFIPGALSSTLMPVMAEHFLRNRMLLNSAFLQGYKYILIMMTPISIGLYVLSDKVILYLYGVAFFESINALRVLSLTILFASLYTIQSATITSIDKQKYNVLVTSLTFMINIILNLLLIPDLSFYGASVATLISVIVAYLLQMGVIYKFLSFNVFTIENIKIIIASVIMGFVTYIFNQSLFVSAIEGMLVYVVVSFILGIIKPEEINQLRSLIKKDKTKEKAEHNN